MGKIKKTLWALVAAATISGTFSGISGGLAPIHTKKTGTSYGINVGVYTEFEPGAKHYGLNLSFGSDIDPRAEIQGANISAINFIDGQISGLNSGFASINNGRIDGINMGVFNFGTEKGNGVVNGLELGIANPSATERAYSPTESATPTTVNGLQIGIIYNHARSEGNCAQIGLVNKITRDNEEPQKTLLVNYDF